jgi:hypothetical protein
MKPNMLHALFLAASFALAPAAFAAGLQGLEGMQEKTVTLKSGKTIKITMGKMDGKMMVVIPADELNDLLSRAEGHSMTIYN